MVRKYFRKITDWGEWKKCWEENDRVEIAIGLLHVSPEVITANASKGLGSAYESGHEVVRFLIKIARWSDEGNDCQREVESKAYHVLLDTLYKHWDSIEPDDKLIQDIIDFFAEDRRPFPGQPYKKEVEEIIKYIWALIKYGHFNAPGKEIKVSRQLIAKALVNAELFDFILQEEILEAIPALQEWMLPLLEAKLRVKKLIDTGKRGPFPYYDEVMLRDPRAWVLSFAIKDSQARQAAKTLLELLHIQNHPLSATVVT